MLGRSHALATLALALLWGCDGGPEASPEASSNRAPIPGPLRFIVSPYRANMAQVFEPLAAAISEEVGAEVEVHIASSYEDAISRASRGEGDLVFLPPLSFLRVRGEAPGMRLLVTEEIRASLYDRAVLVVTEASGIRRLKGAEGRRFALVSRQSASGYLFPRVCLRRHGLDPDRVLADGLVVFSGSHDESLALLEAGEVDVAATYDWAVTEADGQLREGLRVLAWSEPLPHSVVAVRPGFDDAQRERLRAAFLSLSRETSTRAETTAALEQMGITGFSRVTETALLPIERMLGDDAP